MENENMDLKIRSIMERLRLIWTKDAISVTIDYWQYQPAQKIISKCNFWIGTISDHFHFKSLAEIEEWLYKKELLFKKF